MLPVATILGLILRRPDIKGGFLQSEPVTKELYIKPPRDLELDRSILWLLRTLPYGIA